MGSPHPSSVAERLRFARNLTDISARGLARLARLQPSHVSLIESGAVANVRVDTLSAIARVLGCSLDWLVNGEGDAPVAESVAAAVDAARVNADETGEHAAIVDDTGTG